MTPDHLTLRAIREHARALGIGELMHLRCGETDGRVWVAYSRHAPAFGASVAEACQAWIDAHPIDSNEKCPRAAATAEGVTNGMEVR